MWPFHPTHIRAGAVRPSARQHRSPLHTCCRSALSASSVYSSKIIIIFKVLFKWIKHNKTESSRATSKAHLDSCSWCAEGEQSRKYTCCMLFYIEKWCTQCMGLCAVKICVVSAARFNSFCAPNAHSSFAPNRRAQRRSRYARARKHETLYGTFF